MSFLASARFWVATLERVVKTTAEALLLMLGGDHVLDAWSLDGRTYVNVALSAAALALLTSLVSGALPLGPVDSPSVTHDT